MMKRKLLEVVNVVVCLLLFCVMNIRAAESSASVRVVYVNSQGETVSEQVDFMSYFLSQSACQFLMFIYPSYASFKAIKSATTDDDKQWLMYWIIVAFLHVLEHFLISLFVWIPFYWEIKLVFLLWLQWPRTRGAILIYIRYVQPFLKANEAQIDKRIEDVGNKLKEPASRLSTKLIGSAMEAVVDYQANRLKQDLGVTTQEKSDQDKKNE